MSDVLVRLDSDPSSGVLPELAAGLLDRLDELTDRLVTELTGDDEDYRRSDLVPRSDLWHSCRDNLEQVIAYLVARPEDPSVAFAPPAATGRRRAEQGFPLESLLHAYRVGGRLIWQALLEETERDDRAASRELLAGATQVWDVIDAFSSVVGDAYRERRAELQRHSEEQRLMLIDGLLEGRGRDVGFAREAATILDLPERGPYTVVVLRGSDAARPPRKRLQARWRLRASTQVGIVPLTTNSLDDVAAVLRDHLAGPAGISPPVDDLADLAQAHQWAETAAAAAAIQPGVALLDEHLPAALLVSEPLLTRRLRTRVEQGLEVLDDDDRTRLLDTVDAYLATNLSVRDAAERLFCHRNTVRNRLHRFEELTGHDLDDLGDLVEVALARGAARLRPATTRSDGTPPDR